MAETLTARFMFCKKARFTNLRAIERLVVAAACCKTERCSFMEEFVAKHQLTERSYINDNY